jgi:ubiquinone/menaquinone biosynthesis C-methylase UbiE
MTDTENSRYVLGESEDERARLLLKSRMIDDLMSAALARAGLAPGMHALDVGCGVGA